MNLEMTRHARMRQRQRGFSELSIRILEQFGRKRKIKDGAVELFLGKREAAMASEEFRKMIQVLDKVSGSSMIMFGNIVITLFKN